MAKRSLCCWLCGQGGETKPTYTYDKTVGGSSSLLFPVAPHSKWPKVETSLGRRERWFGQETNKRYVCSKCIIARAKMPIEKFLALFNAEPSWVLQKRKEDAEEEKRRKAREVKAEKKRRKGAAKKAKEKRKPKTRRSR